MTPDVKFTTDMGSANSHCLDDRILADGETIAFASEPWTSRILAALESRASDAVAAGEAECRVRDAVQYADWISNRMRAGGYRASLSNVEALRNHVRSLAALLAPPDAAGSADKDPGHG